MNELKNENKCDFVNKFTIRGNLVRKHNDSQVMILIIAAANPMTQAKDFPRVVIFDKELIEKADKDLFIGCRVTCEGIVNTSKKYPAGTLIVKSVTLEKTRMEAEFSNEEYNQDTNKILLCGDLSAPVYKPSDTVSIASIRVVSENGSTSFPRIVCFGSRIKKVQDKQVGDKVFALCYAKTNTPPKKNTTDDAAPDEKKKYNYQSLVAQEIK